jgi:hypothetical protein
MEKFVVFHVEGGLGKNVASTAIIKNIYKKYPDRKLIVVCSFPEIFLNNPYIHRVYRLGVSPIFGMIISMVKILLYFVENLTLSQHI